MEKRLSENYKSKMNSEDKIISILANELVKQIDSEIIRTLQSTSDRISIMEKILNDIKQNYKK